jgi:hypothetical protein
MNCDNKKFKNYKNIRIYIYILKFLDFLIFVSNFAVHSMLVES